jgi:hypothetical protein
LEELLELALHSQDVAVGSLGADGHQLLKVQTAELAAIVMVEVLVVYLDRPSCYGAFVHHAPVTLIFELLAYPFLQTGHGSEVG